MSKPFKHALWCLSHRVTIAALLILLLNDHLLRHLWPSWWTGKLGDAAWLAFAPGMIIAFVVSIIPERWSENGNTVFWLSLSVTGGVFAAANTIPVFQHWLLDVLEVMLGWRMRLVVDPSDLLALPALAIPSCYLVPGAATRVHTRFSALGFAGNDRFGLDCYFRAAC